MGSERTLSAHAGSTARTAGITLISIVLWSLTAGHIFGDSPENPSNAKPAKAALLAVPLSFEANQGQTDSQVKFLSRGDGYSLFLTSHGVVFTLRTPAGVKAPPSVFRMELLGAERNAQVSGADKLPGVANYFIGNDPKKWRSGISAYGKVKYRGIYPGVDAVFYGNQRQLEYDFVVAPGANPKQISLGLTGVTPSLDMEGNVLLRLADGDLTLKKAIVYQNIDGGKKFVDARYTIAGDKVRFQLGKYDHSQTLVIDPVFTYLTYLGGSGPDQIGGSQVVAGTRSPSAQALAIDSAGDVYVTGMTESTDFPVANAYQGASKTNIWTAFVSALNPSGTALLYSTYLGGSDYTEGNSVVWDSHDNALYVVGTTNSPDFPITAGAFQRILSPNEVGVNEVSASQYNAFVAKFSPSGQLTNSTFLGGNYPTNGFGITTDPQGRAYVVGFTQYTCAPPDEASYSCFPTTPGAVIPAGTISQNGNGFVSVFDPKLSTLLYSTLLGDPNGAVGNTSEAFGVTVDPSGNFYVVGVTGSPSLPTTPGAFQPKLGTSNALPALVGFAAKFGPLSASGASLIYLTYLESTGVSFGDLPGGVVADSQGNAYIGGYSNADSTTFPITPGAYRSTCTGNSCAFVTKLNPNGTGLVWSTFVEVADYFGAIQLDAQGNVYVVGHNNEFFQGVNALQPGLVTGGFVSELDPTGSTLLFASLVGSTGVGVNGNSSLSGVAVDSAGSIYVAGNMVGATLPTTPGVVQPSYHGGSGAYGDGMIAKIAPFFLIATLSPLPAATVDTAYSQTLSAAAGSPSYAWSVTSGALPAGLTLSSTGTVSGTPTAAGSFNFTVQVKDSTGATTSAALALTVNPVFSPLSIATVSPLLSGYVNGAYSQTFVATGGAQPYAWSVIFGALPAGLTLSSGGAITGTPSAPGAFSFTVQVLDSNSATTARTFALTIISVAGSLARVGVLPQFAAGAGYTTTVYVTNTSAAPVPVRLIIRGDNGSTTLSVPTALTVTQQGDTETGITATTLDRVLNPYTTLAIAGGQGQAVNVQGWVDVLATTAVSGFAVFTRATTGLTSGGAGFVTPWEGTVPLQTQLSASTITLPFDNTTPSYAAPGTQFTTGIAIGSLTGGSITARFYDVNGNQLGTPQTFTLGALEHTALMVNSPATASPIGQDWSFTNGLQGVVQFTGPALIGLGLRASPYGTLTAVPTILQ
jgi:hypothetical protein